STSTAPQVALWPRSSTPTWPGISGFRALRRSMLRATSTGSVSWIVCRDDDVLPEELIFWVNYLGDDMPTLALNFSRPGAPVVAQYYNFLRLGFDGYRRAQTYRSEEHTSELQSHMHH